MPIYEYKCEECGAVVEELQKVSDPPLEICKKCQGKLSKIMSLNTFHLKGTGWYVTDYSGKNASTAATPGPEAGEMASPKQGPAKEPAAAGPAKDD